MSDLVGSPEDGFSRVMAHIRIGKINEFQKIELSVLHFCTKLN